MAKKTKLPTSSDNSIWTTVLEFIQNITWTGSGETPTNTKPTPKSKTGKNQ